MKNLLIIIGLLLAYTAQAQQIGVTSIFNDTRHFWNPARTGESDRLTTQAFFRQQWMGFDDAPRTGFVGVQMPLSYYNMAVGGLISYDKSGPLQRTSVQLNYAYTLRGLISDNSALAIGISAKGTQYGYKKDGQLFNDEGDVLINTNQSSTFFPSVNMGVKFESNTEEYDGNSFYVGFAYQQLFSGNVFLDQANLQREQHIFGSIGLKFYGEYGYFEPSMAFAWVEPELLDMQVMAKYEFRDLFWAGLGYSNLSQVNFQAGYILSDFGQGDLRIGAAGNMNIGILGEYTGPGFEVLLSYEYDLE